MPFNPFSALTSKIFGGMSIALALAVAVQTMRLNSCHRDRELLEARNATLQLAADNMINDGRRRKQEAKASTTGAQRRAKAIRRTIPVPGPVAGCETPAGAIEAIEEGFRQ